MKLTHPDRYRSTMLPSGHRYASSTSQSRTRSGRFDASPVDAPLHDGRIFSLMCVWISRRRAFHDYISKDRPRASALGIDPQKCHSRLGAWPDTIQDGHTDRILHRRRKTKRLFAALGIEMDLSTLQPGARGPHVTRNPRPTSISFVQLVRANVGHSVGRSEGDRGPQEAFAARCSARTLPRL